MNEIEWRRSAPDDPSRIEAIEDGDVVVGTITLDEQQREWVAEADGQSRTCESLDGAARFIETVREPETVVAVLRTPAADRP